MVLNQLNINDVGTIVAIITGISAMLYPIIKYLKKKISNILKNKNIEKEEDKCFKEKVLLFNEKMEKVIMGFEDRISLGEKMDEEYLKDSRILASIVNRNNIQDKNTEKIMQSILAINRDRLLYLIQSYIKKEEITISEFDNINHLFKAYRDLGGNGTIEELMKDINELEKK